MKTLPLILLYIFILCSSSLKGQDKSAYFFTEVPQVNQFNPAYIPNYTHYISIPAISGLMVTANSSTFSASDFLVKKGNLYVYDSDKLTEALFKLRTNNFVRAEARTDLFNMGFMRKKIYWSVNLSVKSFNNAYVPKSFERLKYGISTDPESISSGIAINDLFASSSSYYEASAGAAYALNDNIKVGLRIKLLSGIASVYTKQIDVRVIPNLKSETLTLSGNILINTSVNNVKFDLNNNNTINSIKNNGNPLTIPFTKNFGLGVDMGVEISSGLRAKIFASVTDLGFISWKNNKHSIDYHQSFLIDYSKFIPDASGTINVGEALKVLVDSLRKKVTVYSSNSSYTTSLFTTAYAGGSYQFFDWLNGAILLKGTVFNRIIDPSVTLLAIAKPTHNLTGSISWSYANNTLRNLGFGIVVGNKPVQFMASIDNFAVTFLNVDGVSSPFNKLVPRNARALGFQFGLNVFWGEKTVNRPWRWKTLEMKRGTNL